MFTIATSSVFKLFFLLTVEDISGSVPLGELQQWTSRCSPTPKFPTATRTAVYKSPFLEIGSPPWHTPPPHTYTHTPLPRDANASSRLGCTQVVSLLIHTVSTAQVCKGFSLQRASYIEPGKAPHQARDGAAATAQAPCCGSQPRAGHRGQRGMESLRTDVASSGSHADAAEREI